MKLSLKEKKYSREEMFIETLFSHLEDCDKKDLVEACIYFHRKYGLDIEELPCKLHDAVEAKLEIDRREVEEYYYAESLC